MRTIWLVSISFAVFTLVAYLGFHFAPAPVGTLVSSPQPNAESAEYQRIVLPHDEPELPPGPGRTEFATNCIICHSPRYVSMQPRFPRKVWKAEVQKMVDAYKAPIGEHDQAEIVNYIVAVFGVEDGRK
jgi:sulfite dehydrogenase (cytochrome) subunit B